MSLISDPDFLIHSLRLNYLRNVDDTYGSRIISLEPSYQTNPYVITSGLADVQRWPELTAPSSPPISDDESGRSGAHTSGYPGASGLKYTTTIMGPRRVGAMGLRVSGKRASISKTSVRNSIRSEKAGNGATPDDPINVDIVEPTPIDQASPNLSHKVLDESPIANGGAIAEAASKSPIQQPQRPQEDLKPPPQNVAMPFIPKFKGAAEMEARRRLRMMNRVPPGGAPMRPAMVAAAHLNPELSSSSESESDVGEEEPSGDEEEDEFDDDAQDIDDSIEVDADEFDPDFAASRGGIGIDADSDGLSLLSGSGSINSANFSMVGSSVPLGSARNRNRLSPVRESRISEEKSANVSPDHDSGPDNSYFEMVTPAPPSASQARKTKLQNGFNESPRQPGSDLFIRRPTPPVQAAKSALTAMLATTSNSSSSNPFTELYSAISGRSEGDSISVSVFFPHAREPANRVMELNVRKDSTVEEVLGFALWTYWEEGWLPKLDEGLDGEEDPKWDIKCSALGWILRIAEEDGEVDEDFPPPDRTGRISKFNFDAYAVLEASAAQVQQNKILDSKIQRRPSRIVIKKKKSTGLLNATAGLVPPGSESLFAASASAGLTSTLGTSVGMFPSSLGPSSSHGPPMFLRIRIADTADAGHVSTTIQASGGMYMAEVLEAVCLKRKLPNPKDYALVVDMNGMKILIPLDRTVKSLQGKRDLMLIKKNMLQHYGVELTKRNGRSTDPNASIFKRTSEVPEQVYSSVFDYTTAYKRYTVYRKVPMLVTRSARALAIDGGYIHIMPQSNKAKNVFDSGKTVSYDIKSIVAVQQSSKNSATFKLVVHRESERNKRYEFEAESPKIANEIVQTIRGLKSTLERSGTTKQSRRSRQVG
ncbi:unnamed protein product [Somion occarium]|uniref:Stress-activated map kinase-interacting protein 1 n=1 Tax=Somion occarium TaxID=3059160 RepID=A0ABP1DNG0_9APHY